MGLKKERNNNGKKKLFMTESSFYLYLLHVEIKHKLLSNAKSLSDCQGN